MRTTYPGNPDGVEVMLERWEAGTEEPPHSHPGDDMTVVVEGKMSIQFYRKEAGGLVPDGERVFLSQGQMGYVRGQSDPRRQVHRALQARLRARQGVRVPPAVTSVPPPLDVVLTVLPGAFLMVPLCGG